MQGEYPAGTSTSGEAGAESTADSDTAVQSTLEPARTKFSHAVTVVQERSRRTLSDVTQHVHDAPMRSVAMAMGLGMVIGLLLGGRRHARWRDRSGS